MVGAWFALSMASCGHSTNGIVKPPSGLLDRVMATQSVTSPTSFGEIVIINGQNDTIPRVRPLSGGTSPGMMAISPTRNVLAAFDAASNSVYAVDTTKEMGIGQVRLPGPTSSIILPTSDPIGYAAVPNATVIGFSVLGAVEQMNFSSNSLTATIGVDTAKTVVANSTASQLLVFSSSNQGESSITILNPGNAVPPVDTSCDTAPNAVCTVATSAQFYWPVYAVVSGSTAYILNCGPQCGDDPAKQPDQASVAVFDLTSLTITSTIPVEAATWALLSGSTLYVAGTPPTNNACTGQMTMAAKCGRLDIIDTGSGTVTASGIVITNGYHDKMDLNPVGQLFIGSHECTNIGNVNNPVGEVRGCLSIYNTATGSVFIPPDNGNVDGLQGFISRPIEYVAEGGNLRVYNVTTDKLLINDFVTSGTIPIVGYVGDVKAIDSF
jgi:hypothetical protein